MYVYRAKILRVVDGDTVDAEVDLGFHTKVTMKLRLYGINAPEVGTAAGIEAKEVLKSQIEGLVATITTLRDKQEKYGRYLAVIETEGGKDGAKLNVNDWLVQNGYAAVYYRR